MQLGLEQYWGTQVFSGSPDLVPWQLQEEPTVVRGNKSKLGDFLVPAHFKSEWFLQSSSWGYVQDRESLQHAGFLWDVFLTACCKSPLLTVAGEVRVALNDAQRRLNEMPAVLHSTKSTGASSSGKTPGEQLSLWLQWVIQFWGPRHTGKRHQQRH